MTIFIGNKFHKSLAPRGFVAKMKSTENSNLIRNVSSKDWQPPQKNLGKKNQPQEKSVF